MLLEAQNRMKMARFIATCGRAYRYKSHLLLYKAYADPDDRTLPLYADGRGVFTAQSRVKSIYRTKVYTFGTNRIHCNKSSNEKCSGANSPSERMGQICFDQFVATTPSHHKYLTCH